MATDSSATGTGVADWLAVYLKGVAMGAADTVPGVSGGTIAVIVGVYERLVTAIAGLDRELLADLGALHRRSGRRRFRETLRRRDVPFLIVLGLGAVSAVVLLSRVMHAALVSLPALTFAFFFGLIAASAVVLYSELAVNSAGAALAGVAGFVLAFLLSGAAAGGGLPNSAPVAFLTGAVAITAMILPGVSGSFLLLLLGQYAYLTGVLTRFVDGLIGLTTGGRWPGSEAVVVVAFGLGAALGLLSVARVIRWALVRHRAPTVAFLVSLMVGSLRLPIREVLAGLGRPGPVNVAAVLVAAAVGAGAVWALDRYTAELAL